MTKATGSLAECWLHFASEHGLDNSEARKRFAVQVGVQASTIKRWVDGTIPEGINGIVLRRYLELQGYKVVEAKEAKDPLVIRLRNEIGDRKIDFIEAQKVLGYSTPQTLRQLLRGEIQLSKDKEGKIEKLLRSKSPSRPEARPVQRTSASTSIKTESEIARPIADMLSAQKAVTTAEAASSEGTNAEEALVILMISSLRSYIPLLEYAISDTSGAAKIREKLRQEPLEIFKISNLFSALCSETALRRLREEEKRRK